MGLMKSIGEQMDDRMSEELPLKHRLIGGTLRLVVGGLAGLAAVKLYERSITLEEADDEEEQTTD